MTGDVEVSSYIGWLISPRVERMGWLAPLAWLVAMLDVLGSALHSAPWQCMFHPHEGQACNAIACYRLVIELNGRRVFAWRHKP